MSKKFLNIAALFLVSSLQAADKKVPTSVTPLGNGISLCMIRYSTLQKPQQSMSHTKPVSRSHSQDNSHIPGASQK